MGLMDDLRNIQPTELGGTGKVFIDADTLQDDKEKYRIQGIDAGEVEKILGGKYKGGTAGGAATTDIIHGLANEQGFTNVVPLLDDNGQPQRDPFGRIIADLTNDRGQSFGQSLLDAGAFDVNKYTTDQQVAGAEIAEGRRRQAMLDGDYTANAFDKAATDIKQAELDEGAKQWGFKHTLVNEAQRAQAKQAGLGHLIADNVQVRNLDRDLNNKALNPFSDSWEQGWTGVSEASYGLLNLLGETTGVEWAAQVGEDGVARTQAKLGEYGTKVLDYTDVNGFKDAYEFLGNNLALSLPQMGVTAAAAFAGVVAAPWIGTAVATGLAITAPAAIYAGQTWNEMEGEKNAAIAVGAGVVQATLDRLGLSIIFKKGVAPKKLLNEAVNKLVKGGATRKAAEATVANATRREIGGLLGDAAAIAKKQIDAKEIFKNLTKGIGIGTVGEAATEAAQEATAYLAATAGSDKEFDFDELNSRLISAAIAGGALGGALTIPGAAYNTGAWADVAYRLGEADPEKASKGEQYSAEEKAIHGRVASIEELAADARSRAATVPGLTLEERADQHATDQIPKSGLDKFTEKALNISALWQGATRNIFTPELQARSRSARILADMFGGNLQRIFSGASYENSKHHRVATYKSMVADPRTFYEATAGRGGLKRSKKEAISDQAYAVLRDATNAEGNFDPALIPDNLPNKQQLVLLGQQLNSLADRMHADQARHNPELGYIKNYLFKYKSLNKASVNNNKSKFRNALIQELGLSGADADGVIDHVLNNPEVNDIDEAYSVVKGKTAPGSHKKRSLALSEKEALKEFFEKDIFSNVSAAVKSAARYTAHQDYIGDNGSVISKLLDDAQAEGVPAEEINKIAARMRDYLDAESGNYKRPTSDLGKSAQKLQKNFMMFTTLAGLPLATISSFVETMLIHKGLRHDQIFGKKGSLQETGRALADTMWGAANQVGEYTIGTKQAKPTDRRQLLKDLGYYEWDVGAATVTGVTEVNPMQQWVYEEFFKWTGLSGFTNFTRAARASIAQDYVMDKAKAIFEQRNSGEPRTREIQEAEEGLRNLGIDVDQYVEVYMTQSAGLPLSPEQQQFMEDTTREATFNFVNEAIALPQSANRPLIYQDPRFALFTQFQGFIATFTANHIPKLWGEYVKRGTPAMKYNAFAVMTTMIMMGFVSQHLKDLIKYGGKTPHLEGTEYLQRGVRASGLLGTGERVLDQFFPLYEQKTDGVGDWVFKTGSGESPALSTGARALKGVGHAIQGEGEKATYYGLKSAPLFGPLTNLNKRIAQGVSGGGWDFKGDN